jgi:hypothetical protein
MAFASVSVFCVLAGLLSAVANDAANLVEGQVRSARFAQSLPLERISVSTPARPAGSCLGALDMKTFPLVCFLIAASTSVQGADASASKVRHRFLAKDESRSKLHYVDQFDPAKSWSLNLPAKSRDMQLIGNNRLLVSIPNGYHEYELTTRQMAKEVSDPKFAGTMTARRRPDGFTIIGCLLKDRIEFHELDRTDRVTRHAAFPGLNSLRLARLTPEATLLFGGGQQKLVEATLDGRIVREWPMPDANYIYQAMRTPDGRMWVNNGYNVSVDHYDAAGKRIARFGGRPEPQGLFFHFFSGFQVLKNGNVVAATWTGHGPDDSRKGQQLVEFNPTGDVVWTWHDPDRAGTVHGVIILDDLDPSVLNDDCNGVLSAVGAEKR